MSAREMVLKIKVTEEERQQIEEMAHRRGYEEPEDYVRALIEADVEAGDELADDALWDKSFAESQGRLDKMADEIHAKYLAGLTEEFDPDTDPDLQ